MKKTIILFLILLLIPFTVNAKVVESDYNLDLEGTYDSGKVIMGYNINNKSTINGISFDLANTIKENGNIEYGFYAAENITISGNIEKDIYIAANNITIENAIINRDVFVAGNSVKVSSDIGRNIYIAANTVDIRNITINGNANIIAENIIANENTVINGKLSYEEDTKLLDLDKATVKETKIIKVNVKNEETTMEKITSFISGMITSYVTLLIILLLFKNLKEKLTNYKVEAKNILTSGILGLGLLIGVPIACILALFTLFLIPLSLVTLVMYILGLYLSTSVVSYILGHKIFTLTNQKENLCLELGAGIIIINILSLIPFIGDLIKFLSLIVGFGILANVVKPQKGI